MMNKNSLSLCSSLPFVFSMVWLEFGLVFYLCLIGLIASILRRTVNFLVPTLITFVDSLTTLIFMISLRERTCLS